MVEGSHRGLRGDGRRKDSTALQPLGGVGQTPFLLGLSFFLWKMERSLVLTEMALRL